MNGMSVAPVPSPFSYEGMLYINAGRGKAIFAVRPDIPAAVTSGFQPSRARFSLARAGERSAMPSR